MLATILKSKIATDVTISIMRAFVQIRHFSLTYGDIVEKLNTIDNKMLEHDEVMSKVIQALNELLADTANNETKKIGFI